jgi:hypothetical protein
MDPVLRLALQNVSLHAQTGVREGQSGDFAAASVALAEAAMTLGMQIGHFRAVLGPRYASSAEAAGINQVAIQLRTSLVLAFAGHEQETEGSDEEEESIEHESTDGVPSYYPADFAIEEEG